MTVRNIKSIGDIPYPIMLGSDGIAAGAVTPDKLADMAAITAGAALGITGNDPASSAWLQRVSTADGPTTVKSIHGRTVRWNQLNNNTSTTNTLAGVTATYNNDGTWTLDGTATANGARYAMSNIRLYQGHKYLVKGCPAGGSVDTYYINISGHRVDSGEGGIYTWNDGDANDGTLRMFVKAAATLTNSVWIPQIFDLTAMFGSGLEPATVAEFEMMFPEVYYPYDAGSLLSVHMTGIETKDANGDPLQTCSIPASTYFPDGLRSAGSVYDELTNTSAITRIGERAYQSGDESDPTVNTDGTVTHYAIADPTTIEITPPLNLTYRTEQGGTERVMVPNGEQSAPPTIVAAQGYTAESLRDAALSAIAPVENGLASTNYGVGSYLVHGGQLCRVTTAIATGESITIGTNVTATTVMAEVIALTQ